MLTLNLLFADTKMSMSLRISATTLAITSADYWHENCTLKSFGQYCEIIWI